MVVIANPEILKGYKWIESRNYGRAYSKGYYEPDVLRCLAHFLEKESIFFDIGGHAGYLSLYGSRLADKVYTFEPDKINFSFFKKIIHLNSVKNIFPFNVGIGSKEGKLFFQSGSTSSTGRVSDQGTIPIDVISIDEFIEANDISRLDVIKIDVEGFGAEVLKGMKMTLRKFRPVIFCEVHNIDEFDEVRKLVEFGYVFYTTDLIQIMLTDTTENQFLIASPNGTFTI